MFTIMDTNHRVLHVFIIYTVTAILFFYTAQFWLRRYQIWSWQNQLQIKKHLTVLNRISAPINGFELSRSARKNNDAFEYVYGEIDTQSFLALISLIRPDASTVFYDLGSGTGKNILACAMVFEVKKACGIELFESLHDAAKQQFSQLMTIPEYQPLAKKIDFICTDFLQISLAEATVIYVAATGLFGDTWEQLNQHLEQLSQRPFIITLTKKLLSPQFKVYHQTKVQMSWGIIDAYIQKK